MTRHILKIATLSLLGLSAPAFACKLVIDEAAAKGRLLKVAKAYLNDDAAAGNIQTFRHFVSKPSPMCPLELTYTAEVDIVSPKKGCRSILEVTHVEPWTFDGSRPPPDQFLVKKLAEECLESPE